MKRDIAQHLDALTACSENELTHRPGYSGRGMYGEKTDAVVAESLTSFLTAIGTLLRDVSDEPAIVSEIGEALENLRYDDLGRNVIIY